MGTIYRNAKLVIGWLGPSNEINKVAFQTIKAWKSVHDSLSNAAGEDISDIIKQLSEDSELMSEEVTEAIVQLSENHWWFRQWISQEIILAPDILLLFGEDKLPWTTLCDADACWRTLSKPDMAGLLQGWQQLRIRVMASGVLRLFNDLRSRRIQGEDVSLADLLPTFRGFLASDPRDKIYALLGFASDGTTITPNYNLPVNTIYDQHFTALLRSSNDLNFLRHCFFDANSTAQGIPSWVPDWSCASIPFSIEGTYSCAGKWQPEFTIFEDLSMLRVRGTVAGRIAKSIPARYLFPPLSREQEQEYWVWKSFIPDHEHAQYPSGEWWGVSLFRTIYMDVDPTTSERFDTDTASFFGLLFAHCWWLRKYHNISERDILKVWFGQEFTLKNVENLNHMTETWLKTYEPQLLSGVKPDRRHLFVTEDGYLGLGPRSMKNGDLVCVILGCEVPLVLRRVASHCVIVGECFMLKIMDGEAFKGSKADEHVNLVEFDIC